MSTSTPSNQTVTEKADPWSGAQPYITDVMEKARGLSNAGGGYYPFSTVVPFSNQTNSALEGIEGTAATQAGDVTGKAGAMAAKVLEGGYMDGSDRLKSIASGSMSAGGDRLSNFATGGGDVGGIANPYATATAPAADYLGSMARGEMVGANPYADKMFDKVQQRIEDSVGAQFGRSGMYGSTNYADSLAENVGDAASNFYGNMYGQDMDRMMSAANTIQGAYDTSQGRSLTADQINAGLREGDMNRRYSAASEMMGNDQENMARRYGATQMLEDSNQRERDRQQQLTLNAGTIANQAYIPYEKMLQTGQIREEEAGRMLEDKMRRYDFVQNQPWQDLQKYSSIVNGYANIGGQSTTSQPLYRNRAAGAIGGGLSGAGIGAQLGGPWGAAIGGGLGVLGGLI